jgi:N-acetylglucosaminyl-diphospho-decaprenol L-rhamnosyltransferase
MNIDVVIVAYRSRSAIGECLDSVAQIEGLGQVIVVDHGGDGAAEVARQRGATVITDIANPGFGAGQNRGISVGSSEFILICNPDAVIYPGPISAGAAFLSQQPGIAALGGKVLDAVTGDPQSIWWQRIGPIYLWIHLLGIGRMRRSAAGRWLASRIGARGSNPGLGRGPWDVNALAATVLLCRRDAFEGVSGFDKGYFMYREDLDLSCRLRRQGWRLMASPDTWATHIGGASSRSPWEFERHWWCGTMRFAACWFTTGQWVSALFAASIRTATLALRRPSEAIAIARALITVPLSVHRSHSVVNKIIGSARKIGEPPTSHSS